MVGDICIVSACFRPSKGATGIAASTVVIHRVSFFDRCSCINLQSTVCVGVCGVVSPLAPPCRRRGRGGIDSHQPAPSRHSVVVVVAVAVSPPSWPTPRLLVVAAAVSCFRLGCGWCWSWSRGLALDSLSVRLLLHPFLLPFPPLVRPASHPPEAATPCPVCRLLLLRSPAAAAAGGHQARGLVMLSVPLLPLISAIQIVEDQAVFPVSPLRRLVGGGGGGGGARPPPAVLPPLPP